RRPPAGDQIVTGARRKARHASNRIASVLDVVEYGETAHLLHHAQLINSRIDQAETGRLKKFVCERNYSRPARSGRARASYNRSRSVSHKDESGNGRIGKQCNIGKSARRAFRNIYARLIERPRVDQAQAAAASVPSRLAGI